MSDPASDAEADAAYAKGVAAIKSGAMDEAIELLAKALELKTAVHGEEAVACAPAYYKYGCALFYKAQDENTVFGKQAQAQADAKDEAAKKAAAGSEEDAEDVEEEEEAKIPRRRRRRPGRLPIPLTAPPPAARRRTRTRRRTTWSSRGSSSRTRV